MKSGFLESPNDVEVGSSEQPEEQLKRDLGARHINMIAIAGMIVSLVEPVLRSIPGRKIQVLTEEIGDWSLFKLRQYNSYDRTCWRIIGIHFHGIYHSRC